MSIVGGRPPRTPEPPNAQIEERQTRHFELHLQGWSQRAIAAATGYARETVQLDIRMEGERRAVDFVKDRQANISTSLGRLQAVIQRALVRGEALRVTGMEERRVEDPTQPSGYRTERIVKSVKAIAAANKTDALIIQAQKQIDTIVGINVELPAGEHAPPPINAQNVAVFLLKGMTPEERLAQLNRIKQEAMDLGALPVPGRS